MPYFHVIPRANQDRPVFADPNVTLDVYEGMEAVKDTAEILAYALMSSHAHFLIYTADASALGAVVARVVGPAARALNQGLQQRGGVLRRPYWRREVVGDAYLHVLPLYIHANSAPASTDISRLDVGLRSSHAAWMSGKPPAWLNSSRVRHLFEEGYVPALRSYLEDRAARAPGEPELGPERLTLLGVSRVTGVRPGTMLDAARGGKRDRMLLAWALGRELGNAQAGRILGVERHTIARWAGVVSQDTSFGAARRALGEPEPG